jgi:hypothetical protein
MVIVAIGAGCTRRETDLRRGCRVRSGKACPE